jgi:F0F1-type ATP synthase membrane subunit b/b'
VNAFDSFDSPSANPSGKPQDIVQRLSVATRKAEELTRRRATVEAQLGEARKNYRRLADAAKEKYGTDNLAVLEAKLRDMEKDNTRKVDQFEADIARAEQQIVEAERVLRAE